MRKKTSRERVRKRMNGGEKEEKERLVIRIGFFTYNQ